MPQRMWGSIPGVKTDLGRLEQTRNRPSSRDFTDGRAEKRREKKDPKKK